MAPDILARKRVYDLIWQYPGLHLRQLQRLAGLDLSLVEYHVNQLERQGVVVSMEQGGYRRFFPLASVEHPLTADDRRVLGLLRQAVPFGVVVLLLERGALPHKDIAAALRVSKPALTYHLKKLAAAGVVLRVPRGEQRGFHLADPERVRALLRAYRPAPDFIEAYGRLWSELYGPRGG